MRRVGQLAITTGLFLLAGSLGWNAGLRAAEPSNSAASQIPRADFQGQTLLKSIAFGSCSKQDKPQPIWEAIVAKQPDLFIYMGDNIYGDTDDMNVLREKWNLQKNLPGYVQLRKTCPVIATWDDHDYGRNDAGAEYPFKRESQQLFLDFLDEPADSPRRTREGVYASYLYGPAGRQVHVILLDTRYFRSPLKSRRNTTPPAEGITGPYVNDPHPAGEMLGMEQWTWLEGQLQIPAALKVIVSSIQLIPDEHGWEKWANLLPQREKFLQLLEQTQAEGVIVLSGDRHASEFSRLPRESQYDLWDVTCSSLNQARAYQNELNRFRVGLMYSEVNFGMLLIDWEQSDPELTMQICGETGRPMLQVRIPLSDLKIGAQRKE